MSYPPELTDLKKPTWKAPDGPPNWEELPWPEAIEAMKHHLQTAMVLELYTIPLYLYAAYSIKNKPEAIKSIMGIAYQEMLHLGLAGNMLCSIGGTPHTYGNEYTPKYPREIFFEKVNMSLRPATKETLGMFVQVEEPYPRESPQKVSDPGILPSYDSIGQFYQNIIHGVNTLDIRAKEESRVLWHPETFGRQFTPEDDSWGGKEMTAIKTTEIAKQALDLIILQGEGAPKDQIVNDKPELPSHYQIFKKLYDDPALDCYPVQPDIDPALLKKEKFYEMGLLAFGLGCGVDVSSFSYLLLTIETLWQYDGKEPSRKDIVDKNMYGVMLHLIRPLAQFLVKQPITTLLNVTANAGFPFRRFDFKSTANALTDLKDQMDKGLAAYPDEPSFKDIRDHMALFIDLKDILPQPETA